MAKQSVKASEKIVKFPVQLPINLERAKALFWEESIVLNGSGGVPLSRVKELFGEEAAEFAFGGDRVKAMGRYANGFGLKNDIILYLYLEGFLKSATYANIQWLAKKEGKA